EERLPIDLAILSGSYFMPAVRLARRYMIRRRIPWYYWGENPRKKGTIGFKGRLKQWLKERYLRWFLAPAAGAAGVGTLARDTLRELLRGGRPTLLMPYAPNLDRLLNPTEEMLQAARHLRQGFAGVSDPVLVLFAGNLIPLKAPDVLLEAFCRAAALDERLCLAMAGDGPLREALVARSEALGIGNRVKFLGFLRGQRLHEAYLAANLFVLPTRTYEGWGVVVQEAMAAGIPAIVSERVGCRVDLVHEGETGHVVPADDPTALAARIVELAADDARREQMGANARVLASRFSSRSLAASVVGQLLDQHRPTSANELSKCAT
ncbi:MAG: glycosyltransferase family 4 protein, partial [Bryobacteraceae bacterium]|nr:glycosyltransferase family 4 protein [Bryobacteraceae bacterium]